MIAARGGVSIQVIDEICQSSVEWALNIVVPIFIGKDDIRNCCCYGVVKLLFPRMKVVVTVSEKGFVG